MQVATHLKYDLRTHWDPVITTNYDNTDVSIQVEVRNYNK